MQEPKLYACPDGCGKMQYNRPEVGQFCWIRIVGEEEPYTLTCYLGQDGVSGMGQWGCVRMRLKDGKSIAIHDGTWMIIGMVEWLLLEEQEEETTICSGDPYTASEQDFKE